MPNATWKEQRHTSIGIEPPDLEVKEIRNREEIEGFSLSGRRAVILGGGSNSLFGEVDAEIVVVRLSYNDIEVGRNSRTIRVGAGCNLDDVVDFAAAHNLSGLETLAGIPGTVGGAIVQNAGSHRNEIANHLRDVECWDRLHRRWALLTSAQCAFSNRNSVFLKNRQRYLIYEAVLSPLPQPSPVEGLLGPALIDYVRRQRNEKFPSPVCCPNSGSVLVHPLVPSGSTAHKKAVGMGIPFYEEHGWCKIPVGAVLEKLGFKGKDFGGGIALSSQHANFLVRYRDTNLEHWLAAVKQMRLAVAETLGFAPEVEPTVLGTCLPDHPEIRGCEPAPF